MAGIEYDIVKIKTEPFEDQAADVDGLIKSVKHFKTVNYVENYIQSFFHLLNMIEPGGELTIVSGSDGRYYSSECLMKLVQMAAANPKIKKLLIAQNGIITTAASSCYIRRHKLDAGVLFTASSRAGGPKGDFGIKFEDHSGAPMNKVLLDQIYQQSSKIKEYFICPDLTLNFENLAVYKFLIRNGNEVRNFFVEIFDSVDDYLNTMKHIFNFKVIRNFIKSGARIVVNTMNGAAGPYVQRILCQELGLPDFELVKFEPLEDFGELIPEPVPANIDDIFSLLFRGVHEVGFAISGDGQQFIVIGREGLYIQPYDSLAILAANLESIAYYKTNGVKGFCRTFNTSRSIDRVAKDSEKNVQEIPDNWINASNLLETEEVSLAGDDKFSVGAEHCREKDGIWAVLAWLNILETRRTVVNRLIKYHWNRYGRNVYACYHFDKIDEYSCRLILDKIEDRISNNFYVGKTYTVITQQVSRISSTDSITVIDDSATSNTKIKFDKCDDPKSIIKYEIFENEILQYEDPYDGSEAYKEGVRLEFTEGSRITFNMVNTINGTQAFRIYIDKMIHDSALFDEDARVILRSLYEISLVICQIKIITSYPYPIITP